MIHSRHTKTFANSTCVYAWRASAIKNNILIKTDKWVFTKNKWVATGHHCQKLRSVLRRETAKNSDFANLWPCARFVSQLRADYCQQRDSVDTSAYTMWHTRLVQFSVSSQVWRGSSGLHSLMSTHACKYICALDIHVCKNIYIYIYIYMLIGHQMPACVCAMRTLHLSLKRDTLVKRCNTQACE